MKIGINYLNLKDIKPGTVLTIVDRMDIETHPAKPYIFIHRKNKKQFNFSFVFGMREYCGQKFTVVKLDEHQKVYTKEGHGFSFSLSMFQEVNPFDPEIIWKHENFTKK